MKIGFVHWVVDPVMGAGMAVKTAAVSRALAATGADVRVIASDAGLDPSGAGPALPNVDVVVLPSRGRRFTVPQVSASEMLDLVRDRDVLFLMNYWTAINAMAARAARRARVPYGICPGGALRIQGRSRGLKHLYQWAVGRRLLRDAAVILATTPLEASQFAGDGVPRTKIEIIPNGVDVQLTGASGAEFRETHAPGNAPFVLFVGRLNPIKGPDLLLDAFARDGSVPPDWQLLYAGSDEGMEAELHGRAAALGVTARVRFLGQLEPAMRTGAYRAAALLAVPSRHEAMSQVALEAAAAGTPVLLTDACGFDDVERVGGGLVVAPTVEAIADGLRELTARDDELPAMGDRLRQFVSSEFGWPVVTRQYLELFERMVAGPSGRRR